MSRTTMEPSLGLIHSPPTAVPAAPGFNVGGRSDDALNYLSQDQKAALHRTPTIDRARPKGSFTPYHKPIRPEWSRSSASTTASQREQIVRSTTPSDAGLDFGIGMALGSPTHPPDYAMSPWPRFSPTVTTTVESPDSYKENPSKSKSRKWGIFARTRSKRDKAPDTRLRNDPPGSRSTSPLQRPRQADGDILDGRAALYPRPRQLAKSRTDPTMGERTQSPQAVLTRRGTSSPLARDAGRQEVTRYDRSSSPESPSSDKLLDINIPDVTMERYSIMFGHLIEDRSTTSLLARRQATRDRLKAINDGEALARPSTPSGSSPIIHVLRRNVTKMQLATQESGAGPRLRSNTFPAALLSPPQADFKARETSPERRDARLHVAASARFSGDKVEAAAATSLPGERPRLISKFHRRSSSDQGLVSRSSPPAAHNHSQPSNKLPGSGPKILPVTWNTAHPPVSSSSHGDASLTASPARVGAPAEREPDEAPVQDAVQVSIARQISLSRQQQALLGPLQKQMSRRKRVNETKSSTPHFIDPWQDPKTSPALHRMSERAIVERA